MPAEYESRALMQPLNGIGLTLRLVRPDDASYIVRLRQDTRYNTHLSTVKGDVGDQQAWIELYKEREAAGKEFYFVIERRKDAQVCGLVRLYDIEGDRFTWGSWILDEKRPPKAALESAVLLYDFAFGKLGLKRSVFDVRRENDHVLAFHDRFGAVRTHEDDLNYYFDYTKARFMADKQKYMKLLQSVGT